MAIKGVLFDKDGTLLDYEATWMPVNWEAARTVARGDESLAGDLMVAGGYDLGLGAVRPGTVLAAGNTIEIAAAWAAHLPGQEDAALVALIDDVFERESAASAVQVTELRPLFQRLKARGLEFMSAPPEVSTRRFTTPHSRMKLPSMNMPMSGVTAGISRAMTATATKGKMMRSRREPGRSSGISISRSAFGVSSRMIGG